MFRIRKTFKIEYAHQLDSAYSKACTDAAHGHSGLVEVFLTSDCVNEDGMVIDFGALKNLIGEYMQSWDHALIISEKMSKKYGKTFLKTQKKIRVVPYNPTAEMMAYDMYHRIFKLLIDANLKCQVEKVRFHETATGWAEWST